MWIFLPLDVFRLTHAFLSLTKLEEFEATCIVLNFFAVNCIGFFAWRHLFSTATTDTGPVENKCHALIFYRCGRAVER